MSAPKLPLGAGLLATILLIGCGSQETRRFASLDEPIEADAGETFEVALEANSSTGYEWRLTEKPRPRIVRYEGSDYVPDAGSEDYDGGGGEQILRFTAVSEGQTTIALEYVFTGGEERRAPAARMSGSVFVR